MASTTVTCVACTGAANSHDTDHAETKSTRHQRLARLPAFMRSACSDGGRRPAPPRPVARSVRRASAVATRSGAAGQGCSNRGSQVLIAAISGRVIRVVGKARGGVDARRMSRGEPLDRRGSGSVRTEGPRFRRVRPGGDGRCRPHAKLLRRDTYKTERYTKMTTALALGWMRL